MIDEKKQKVLLSEFGGKQAEAIWDSLQEKQVLWIQEKEVPIGVLLSVEEYARLKEQEEDFQLYLEAQKRLEKNRDKSGSSMEQVMKELGIYQEELVNSKNYESVK